MSEKRYRPRPPRRNDLHDKRQDLLFAWSDELCNSEEVPEVEIVSLLQEHIPKYRLRADSLTQFGGYENQDWFIPSPALPVNPEDLALTPDQIRETLNYFLLCSNRVSQMTKTYNDIEAVTRLLEEKEKDLELTARIGKELLTANGRLESRVTALEGELRGARDLITQLKHELSAKSDLLQILTNDTEEGSPTEEKEAATAALLRRRTGALERENRALREEAQRLAAGADCAELAERQLLRDIAAQLASANSETNELGSELAEERQRSSELQQQLDSTNARLTITERNLQQLTTEHEHTLRILEITRENQNALASELADAKERYAEVAAHLAEAQEALRQVRKRGEPVRGLMPSVAAAAGLLPNSLHREMHSSVYSELSLDSGIGDPLAHSSMQKVFETVQCASRWSGASLSGSEPESASVIKPKPKTISTDSFFEDVSDAESEEMYPGGAGVGVPGAPGAAELAAALRRLTPQEIDSRRASLAASHVLRHRRHTERDISEESAVWGAGVAGGAARFRAPHKLQIVKPMEGSLTLHTWAQLAKPTMSGLLEEQEGVGVRGSRSAQALGLRMYRLSDVEEDDDMLRLPHSSHIYTFTNSTVLHPNDGSLVGSSVSSVCSSGMSSLSSSVLGSAWSSRLTSRRSSAAVSPVHSRRESLCVPPARPHFTPTATPANSPLLGSPDSSPPPTPRPGDAPPSLHALIASGTSILRRRYLTSPSADGSPAPLALQTPGSLYTGLVHRSPMEQLTCLKRTLRSPAAQTADRSDIADAPLGVPAHPGEGALDIPGVSNTNTLGRRTRGPRAPRPRTDLGTVGATPTTTISQPVSSSPLGTLSTFLFGRKGGLL
ncbi:trafficking kinesin-binding protein milt isoform X3 [Colias croceus]|uniref:trafficking kinesin-binding protein milt isoform X1 n=2 Tax=Colias crocea TaxID=72248 RepID=UPI001E28000E|nr:trafficking kinesin-binding protein milt isoform X1 [Colias croceus]XP_045491904.1 trafficking kinesin-binding protein milt isoform X2 [Colias croceus]XP_045491905.1 trafficking kinesin-binding protein milt isoform X3 [Colias croceus]